MNQEGVGTNRYAYSGNDPVNGSDRNGHFSNLSGDCAGSTAGSLAVACDPKIEIFDINPMDGIDPNANGYPDDQMSEMGGALGLGIALGFGLLLQSMQGPDDPADQAPKVIHPADPYSEYAGDAVTERRERLEKIKDAAQGGTKTPPRNYSLAGASHPVTGIPFDKDGFPDFTEFAIATVTISQSGSRSGDNAQANALAGYSRTPVGYTWHHHQDGTTMQLVPTSIHLLTGHTGGYFGR